MENAEDQKGTALAETGDASNSIAKPSLQARGGEIMAIIPQNIDEASRYAKGLIAADQVPDAFRYDGKKGNQVNPSLVIMGLLKCLELDLPPQTGLANILPLNGRFTVWGDAAIGLLQREDKNTGEIVVDDFQVEWMNKPDDWEKIKSQTDLKKWPMEYGCRVSIWRKGQKSAYVGEYTVADATRAGLWASTYRKPWMQSPERMLFNRARAFAMRDGFADRLLGLGIREEVEDSLPPQGARQGKVDNSMLDDDLSDDPKQIEQSTAPIDLEATSEAYINGLSTIDSLEALADYQSSPESRETMQRAQDEDEAAYKALIAANAKRYKEIEAAEAQDREESEGGDDATGAG